MRVSLSTAMQYRSDFLFQAFTGLLRTAANVAALLLVFLHRDEVAGWTMHEALLVMALFLLMNSLVQTLIEPNLGAVVEAIRKGTLDLLLMKPADAQLLVSLNRVAPAQAWDGLAALALGGWALSQLPTPPTVLDVVVAVGLLVCGMVAIYGLWLLAISTSFWFVRVDNLRFLLMSVSDAGRWPLAVFAGWVRVLLTVVVPVGIVTSFPALALRGAWSGSLLVFAAATATLFVLASRWVWKRSLAAYTSASS
jgi:ABC-2 type transport system permease protein